MKSDHEITGKFYKKINIFKLINGVWTYHASTICSKTCKNAIRHLDKIKFKANFDRV